MTDTRPDSPKRRVSVLLGIGIFLLPIIFAWFLLRRGHSVLARVVGFGWLGIVVIAWLAGLGGGAPTAPNAVTNAGDAATVVSAQQPEKAAASAARVEAPAQPALTRPQQNAARSARDYLRISGFSRKGLIEQLSSPYGSGYDVADATAAVDSLNVDWNENAARSAQQYLGISGFSCRGLIEQLSSDAGSQYTVSEATYGARQAGAC